MKNKNYKQLLALATCIIALAVVAVVRDGKVWGHKMSMANKEIVKKSEKVNVMSSLPDGTVIINTTSLAKDVNGYGGNVPLDIYLKDGKVVKIKALKNSETPEFFAQASKLLTAWNGKKIDDAQKMKVDGVSGATYSSRGILGNVQRGLQYVAKNALKPSPFDNMDFSAKNIAGLVVVLMGAIIPLFYRKKTYRTVQLVLNVAVLGLWCGTFISYSLLVGYMSSGINIWISIIPIIMLITAFVYPLFGKKSHYCTYICPCGSLQELAGRLNKHNKLKMKPETVKMLGKFREILWAVLMMMMLVGVGFEWMDYEIFSAFIITSASVTVLVIAAMFMLLSIFVPRPYCRFVCPTGTLFKVAQNSK